MEISAKCTTYASILGGRIVSRVDTARHRPYISRYDFHALDPSRSLD